MSSRGVHPERSSTARGLRWLVLSLAIALAADGAVLAAALAFWSGPLVYAIVSLPLSTAYVVLGFACAAPAFVGFRSLRRGRAELGPAHRMGLRRGAAGFIVGGAAAALLTLTGIFLGLFYIPAGAYVAGATYSSPLELAFGETLRAVHVVTPSIMAVFLGFFLIESVWDLATRPTRILSLAALASGVLVPILTVPPIVAGWAAFLGPAFALLGLISAASLAMWITVLLLVDRRLGRGAPSALLVTAAASPRAPSGSKEPPVHPAIP